MYNSRPQTENLNCLVSLHSSNFKFVRQLKQNQIISLVIVEIKDILLIKTLTIMIIHLQNKLKKGFTAWLHRHIAIWHPADSECVTHHCDLGLTRLCSQRKNSSQHSNDSSLFAAGVQTESEIHGDSSPVAHTEAADDRISLK